ncbi:MAG: site-specific DNA-methyltransferase [Thermosediminibacteraceae bacterium]|nr:site-specific DNA-methyltransferase [Thermosediminibacteraceae bacterium]
MINPPINDIDLNFHNETSTYATHAIHAFAAKFPPQLPRTFIEMLTNPGDVILDPMNGSGTTTLEAYLLNRFGIGCDIDPLAIKIAKAKVTRLNIDGSEIAEEVCEYAKNLLINEPFLLREALEQRFDEKTKEFINYWFLPETQMELMSLMLSIERFERDTPLREFLEVIFSSIIVTKSGGVTRARDLAHSRPHLDINKVPQNAIDMYQKRLLKFATVVSELPDHEPRPIILSCDTKNLELPSDSVDLVVTSPPYANAIDYMRAHKFSLVWFGIPITQLSNLRKIYIGSESTSKSNLVILPPFTESILEKLGNIDSRKEAILRKYYSEMREAIAEMFRVLKPGHYAILVVGTSTMRGVDVKTPYCLADIAEKDVGFHVVDIKSRELDRNRRMLPVRNGVTNNKSVIEQRMHTEEVIILRKPALEY